MNAFLPDSRPINNVSTDLLSVKSTTNPAGLPSHGQAPTQTLPSSRKAALGAAVAVTAAVVAVAAVVAAVVPPLSVTPATRDLIPRCPSRATLSVTWGRRRRPRHQQSSTTTPSTSSMNRTAPLRSVPFPPETPLPSPKTMLTSLLVTRRRHSNTIPSRPRPPSSAPYRDRWRLAFRRHKRPSPFQLKRPCWPLPLPSPLPRPRPLPSPLCRPRPAFPHVVLRIIGIRGGSQKPMKPKTCWSELSLLYEDAMRHMLYEDLANSHL